MSEKIRSILAVSAAILFWSSSFIATKIAGTCFTPLLLCLVRFVFASFVLLILRIAGLKPARPAKQDMWYIFLTSFAGITVYYALENIGVQMTTAGNASLISAAYPAIVALSGILFWREKTSGRMLAGIGIALIGVLLVLDLRSLSAGEGGYGNLLLVFDGFLWAYYNYTMQKISPGMDPVSISYYQILIGTVLFMPMVWLERPVFTGAGLSAWLAVAYLAVCCTAAALLLYNYGLRRIPASLAASLMNLSPVFGVLLSVWILHESVTLQQILGGAIILLGVWISASDPGRKSSG